MTEISLDSLRCLASRVSGQRGVRFFLVGGLNTAFGYGLFSLLVFLGLHYLLATLVSTVAGIIFNFKTYGALVFRCHDNSRIFRFFGVYIVIYALNSILLFASELMHVNIYLASFLMLGPVTVVSYILQKRFVFPDRMQATLPLVSEPGKS